MSVALFPTFNTKGTEWIYKDLECVCLGQSDSGPVGKPDLLF